MPLLNPASDVFLLKTSASCNSYLIRGQKNILIDSGAISAIPFHIAMLKKLNMSPEDIDLILHTHGHYDHFQANKIYKAKALMSEFDARHVIKKDSAFTRMKEHEYYPKINSFLRENQTIKFFPFKLKVIFSPGHTKGSVSFFEPHKKWLFSGDTVFYNTIGRTDLPSGSLKEIENSIRMLSKLKIKFLFPGHGKIVSGTKENKENFSFIKNLFDHSH
jgi:glyoxylase-like metal-dependent hydrolase (beta-lactamase superfamily II)